MKKSDKPRPTPKVRAEKPKKPEKSKAKPEPRDVGIYLAARKLGGKHRMVRKSKGVIRTTFSERYAMRFATEAEADRFIMEFRTDTSMGAMVNKFRAIVTKLVPKPAKSPGVGGGR